MDKHKMIIGRLIKGASLLGTDEDSNEKFTPYDLYSAVADTLPQTMGKNKGYRTANSVRKMLLNYLGNNTQNTLARRGYGKI